jgi:hypothetical protein
VGFDDGSRGLYWVQTPDVLTPFGPGVQAALQYTNAGTGAAALQYDGSNGGGKVVYFGFPFETIADAGRRADYMRDILDLFAAPEVLIPSGAVWKYHDLGEDLGTAWVSPAYNDASWASGPAQLGFGDGDEATVLGSDPARVTTYFRRAFVIPNPRKYRTLRLRLLRDDGAVVWLNGAEVLRSNMPATGALTWATSASTAISGAAEGAYQDFVIDARELRTGVNVIAVEVHQFGTASSDLSFDLELSAEVDAVSTLIASGSAWRFRDNGIAPPSDWISMAFNDASWSEGLAPLGYGGKGEATVVAYGTDPQVRHRTTWFRQSFFVDDPSRFDALNLELRRDDGAIVYLNGVELLRSNLPSGPVMSTTLASTDVAGAAEQTWFSYLLPATALRAGPNVVAVELHQFAPNSADLLLDLRLSGVAQGAMTYDQWKTAKFGADEGNATLAGETANPDGDAARNILEYAGGTEPTLGGEMFVTESAIVDGRLALRFNRNALATDLTLSVQAADAVGGPWSEIARSTSGDPFAPTVVGITVAETASGAVRAVEVRDAVRLDQAPSGNRFLRLEVRR